MNAHRILGKNVPRIDGVPKATGASQYAADLRKAGCLQGRILRSPYPHARVLHIDTSKALKHKGVETVLTAGGLPRVHYGQWILDQTLFHDEKVRYVGDEIAAVAAVDDDTAQEALDLIQVEYEELPAIFDPLEALEPDAPLIHEDFAEHKSYYEVVGRQGNQVCRLGFRYGEVETGLREADEVIENRYTTHSHHPTYLETHAALADCGAAGNLTVWTTTQGVSKIQEWIGHLLDIPGTRIRVISSAVGGGFGGKKPRADLYAAALAFKTRKPVRVILGREEDFAVTFKRHPAIIDIRSGVKRDGTLTAWDFKMVMDTGAYADHGPSVASFGGFKARGPYKTPHVNIEARVVYTNKNMSGAFRGYGNPQVTFATESQMDVIAQSLDIDPVELRRLNGLGPNDMMVNGACFSDVWFRETLDQAAETFGWDKGKKSGSNGRKRGIGIAAASHPTGGWSSSANVKWMSDGSLQVVTGTVEIGAGQHTVAAQLAAEVTGVPYEKVRIVASDTDLTPFDLFTGASRSTLTMGGAVRLAAMEARDELLRRAADMLEARQQDLQIEDERVFISSSPDRGLSFAELARVSNTHQDGPILGKGSWSPPTPPSVPEYWDGAPMHEFPAHGYVAHIAEVEVDEETGEVELLRLVCSHDVGRVINRGGLEGQIEGGVTQGIGYALAEELCFEEGVLTNGTMVDYKIPTILDVPPIEYRTLENPDPNGPFGAKGMGESVLVPTAPAIANAVFDAVGVRIKDLPVTAEKILSALQEKRAG